MAKYNTRKGNTPAELLSVLGSWPPISWQTLTIKAGYFMNNNVFMVDTLASTAVIKNALHDRLFQIKALVECLRLSATTHELNSSLVHDAMWAIDNNLEQAIQLQEVLDEG